MSDKEPGVQPRIVEAKTGWFAHGIGWAVQAPTRDEVIAKYWARVELYREVDRRGEDTGKPPSEGGRGKSYP
jgi:hypothetical protein